MPSVYSLVALVNNNDDINRHHGRLTDRAHHDSSDCQSISVHR